MKFELRQQFQIESARYLPNLPPSHPCARMHGHSFKIILRLQGEADPTLGWVRDYHEIQQIVHTELQTLDHRILNDVPGLENPTSENLSRWIFEKIGILLPELVQVIVQETPGTECRFPII